MIYGRQAVRRFPGKPVDDATFNAIVSAIPMAQRTVYKTMSALMDESGRCQVDARKVAELCDLSAGQVREARKFLRNKRLIDLVGDPCDYGGWINVGDSYVELTTGHPVLSKISTGRGVGRSGPRSGLTALYRFFDGLGILIYVGITNETHERFDAHRSADWFKFAVGDPDVWIYGSRSRAESAEREAIESEHPLFNGTYGTPATREIRQAYLARGGMTAAHAEALADLDLITVEASRAMRVETVDSEGHTRWAPCPTCSPQALAKKAA